MKHSALKGSPDTCEDRMHREINQRQITKRQILCHPAHVRFLRVQLIETKRKAGCLGLGRGRGELVFNGASL